MAARKPKRRPCPSCGASFQRGKVVMRLVVGTAARVIVCQKCAALATPVLASDAPAVCQMCHSNLAAVCRPCLSSALSRENQANMLIAALRKPGRKFKRTKAKL